MGKLRPLSPELAEVASRELNEVSENRDELIAEFRNWILAQSSYLTARTDDQFLVTFLRFAHWNLEVGKDRIIFFYTYKTKERDLLKSFMLDDKLLQLARTGIFATLPNPIGPGGPRIHYTRMGLIDTSKFCVADFFRFHCFRSEIELNTDDNWNIAGVVEIIDFTKIPYSLILQFDPGMFRRMNAYLEHGIPSNLVGTHIVNASRETQFVLGLIRNVMKQKELLHIHANLDSLQKAIGKQYLPVELGGENGTLPEVVTAFEKQLTNYTQYFEEEQKYGCDEKQREAATSSSVNKLSNAAPAGLPALGSIRKMNFD